VILHLGYLGYRSWCPEGIDARRGLDLTQKVRVPDMLEVELSMPSRISIEDDRKQQRTFVLAAD
jgi:hypothetical protein